MILKNGYLINPKTKEEGIRDIRIEHGIIKEIGVLEADSTEDTIDLQGLIVAPGLIDTHIHFRDPGFTYKEDLHSGSLSAAKGGFTSVVCMANTKPSVDNTETLSDILTRAKDEQINIYQAAAVTTALKGAELTDMEALANAGACGFTDDGIPLCNAAMCFEAMKRAAALDMPISLHEEDPAFITNNGINAGKAAAHYQIPGSPAVAEEVLVARDCMLALHSGAHVVIQHISSKNSVAQVRLAKSLGAHIHAEATPHHFTLTEDAVIKHGTLAKMNPPLRTEADRLAIIEGLKDGSIDLIATDHAPHSTEEKSREITQAPSGIIGLETSLSLGIMSLVEPGHLSMMQLLEKMTCNPADLYHLPGGNIAVDAPADFVIFDPKATWIADHFVSKSCNSPFTNTKMHGKVMYTICNGEVIYQA